MTGAAVAFQTFVRPRLICRCKAVVLKRVRDLLCLLLHDDYPFLTPLCSARFTRRIRSEILFSLYFFFSSVLTIVACFQVHDIDNVIYNRCTRQTCQTFELFGETCGYSGSTILLSLRFVIEC